MTATAPPPGRAAPVAKRNPATAAAASHAVQATALERRYRGGRGVGPVDLDVRRGETLGVMGHNGSGKTTLLRLCATLDPPDSGHLSWFGSHSAREARSRIGIALDATEEETTLSGRQAATFWCSQWTGRGRARALVDAWLQRLGLRAVADEPVAAYSFGMRRRLALVEALAHEPDLALLDEPTAGLDPAGAAALATICADRATAGGATLIASNDAAFVALACDRVAFLDAGRLVRVATPSSLLDQTAGDTVVELELAELPGAAALAIPATVGALSPGAVARLRPGADLAELVAAVDRPRGRLLSLRVRRATLADAYARATGSTLTSPAEPGRQR
jgi:ABC-2 type transport system ATP-binding protein